MLTLRGFPGRVSCLLSIENKQLITASCPNDPHGSQTKAEIVFWDFRHPVDRRPVAPLAPLEEVEGDQPEKLNDRFSYLKIAKQERKERK